MEWHMALCIYNVRLLHNSNNNYYFLTNLVYMYACTYLLLCILSAVGLGLFVAVMKKVSLQLIY